MDYETLKHTVHKTARGVKRASENLYESSKLSVKISKKEASVEDKFLLIGELVYNSYAKGEPSGEKVSELCEQISEDYAEINRMKKKRDIILWKILKHRFSQRKLEKNRSVSEMNY